MASTGRKQCGGTSKKSDFRRPTTPPRAPGNSSRRSWPYPTSPLMKSCPPSRSCCRRRHSLNSCRSSSPTSRSSGSRTRTSPLRPGVCTEETSAPTTTWRDCTSTWTMLLTPQSCPSTCCWNFCSKRRRTPTSLWSWCPTARWTEFNGVPTRPPLASSSQVGTGMRMGRCQWWAFWSGAPTTCHTKCTTPNSGSFKSPHSFQKDNFWLVINPDSFESTHSFQRSGIHYQEYKTI